jgi:hypothetical protein
MISPLAQISLADPEKEEVMQDVSSYFLRKKQDEVLSVLCSLLSALCSLLSALCSLLSAL